MRFNLQAPDATLDLYAAAAIFAANGPIRPTRDGGFGVGRDGGRLAAEYRMLDLMMLALGVGFFLAAILYTLGCDRL